MNDSVLDSAQTLKGLFYDMLTGLCKHLNGNVVGNKIFLNKCAKELILGFRRRRKSHLYLLKAKFYEKLEELKLFLKTHRNDQRLISISEVNRAPDRRFIYIILLRPLHLSRGSWEILSCILVYVIHRDNIAGQSFLVIISLRRRSPHRLQA